MSEERVGDNVVPLRIVADRKDEGRRVRIRRPPYDECEHRSVELDEKHRLLTCKKCDRVVDPFHFLKLMAYETHSLDWRVQTIHDFEAKERKKAEDKKAACAAAGHKFVGQRQWCRCRENFRPPVGYRDEPLT